MEEEEEEEQTRMEKRVHVQDVALHSRSDVSVRRTSVT